MSPSKSPRARALSALRNLSNERLNKKTSIAQQFHAEMIDPEGAAYEDRAVARHQNYSQRLRSCAASHRL